MISALPTAFLVIAESVYLAIICLLTVALYLVIVSWKILAQDVVQAKKFLINLSKAFFCYLEKKISHLKWRNRRLLTKARNAKMSDSDSETIRLFEFVRVKPMKKAVFDQNSGSNNYKVPKKRSGHRAVCNEDNLWIWGGYCPLEEQSDSDDNETEIIDDEVEEEQGDEENDEEYDEYEELPEEGEEEFDEIEAHDDTNSGVRNRSPLFPEVIQFLIDLFSKFYNILFFFCCLIFHWF